MRTTFRLNLVLSSIVNRLFNFDQSSRLTNMCCRCISSHDWLQRQRKDPYVKMAKHVNYRARSAFKLIEIDDKFRIFKPGQVVLDIGASPGSWSQVAAARVNSDVNGDFLKASTSPSLDFKSRKSEALLTLSKPDSTKSDQPAGLVIGVDLLHIDPLPGAIFLSDCDFTKNSTKEKLLNILKDRPVDVVLSDMAPNSTGTRELDHDMIISLCMDVLEFSKSVLKPGGTLLCKIWAGRDQNRLADSLKSFFESVRNVKPQASREDSAELYILATKFKK